MEEGAVVRENPPESAELTEEIYKIRQVMEHDIVPSMPRIKRAAELLCLPFFGDEAQKALSEIEGDRVQSILASGKPFEFPVDCPGVSPGVSRCS